MISHGSLAAPVAFRVLLVKDFLFSPIGLRACGCRSGVRSRPCQRLADQIGAVRLPLLGWQGARPLCRADGQSKRPAGGQRWPISWPAVRPFHQLAQSFSEWPAACPWRLPCNFFGRRPPNQAPSVLSWGDQPYQGGFRFSPSFSSLRAERIVLLEPILAGGDVWCPRRHLQQKVCLADW